MGTHDGHIAERAQATYTTIRRIGKMWGVGRGMGEGREVECGDQPDFAYCARSRFPQLRCSAGPGLGRNKKRRARRGHIIMQSAEQWGWANTTWKSTDIRRDASPGGYMGVLRRPHRARVHAGAGSRGADACVSQTEAYFIRMVDGQPLGSQLGKTR